MSITSDQRPSASFEPSIEQLGCVHTPEWTTFGVWAPHADHVAVRIRRDAGEIRLPCTRRHDCWYAHTPDASPGDRYSFEVHTADGVLERVDPRARSLTNSAGEGVIVATPSDVADDFVRPPLNELVIYELHPRTFAGTLDDVADRLDHLAHLGVNAVELMPLAEFAGDLSWGYNPAHPFAIEASYGGPDALRRLVRRAHSLGIAVIVDVVYNHFGPSDLDLWRFDGWFEHDGGGIYFYNDWRAETTWGHTRPDYGRDEVRQYIIDNALMWFDEYRVDGLRLDSTVNIRNAHGHGGPDGDLPDGARLLRDLTDTVHAHHPGAVLIAEDLLSDPLVTAPTEDGGLGFDLQWSADFVHPVRAAIECDPSDVDLTEALIEQRPFTRVVYTESHDEVANGRTRVVATVDPDDPDSMIAHRRAALGAVLTMTVAEVPMLFQGQEWADHRWFDDRHDVEWDVVAEQTGTVSMWRDLIRLRTGLDDRAPGLRGDQVRPLPVGHADALAYLRWGLGGEDTALLVVANLGAEAISCPIDTSGEWRCIFDTSSPEYHQSGDHSAPQVAHGELALGAHTAAVFSR